jgi:hypothetical protein
MAEPSCVLRSELRRVPVAAGVADVRQYTWSRVVCASANSTTASAVRQPRDDRLIARLRERVGRLACRRVPLQERVLGRPTFDPWPSWAQPVAVTWRAGDLQREKLTRLLRIASRIAWHRNDARVRVGRRDEWTVG